MWTQIKPLLTWSFHLSLIYGRISILITTSTHLHLDASRLPSLHSVLQDATRLTRSERKQHQTQPRILNCVPVEWCTLLKSAVPLGPSRHTPRPMKRVNQWNVSWSVPCGINSSTVKESCGHRQWSRSPGPHVKIQPNSIFGIQHCGGNDSPGDQPTLCIVPQHSPKIRSRWVIRVFSCIALISKAPKNNRCRSTQFGSKCAFF